MGEDYFLMPESDVLLRAEWGRLSIVKSMDGSVHVVYLPIIQEVGYDDSGNLYNERLWKYRSDITKVVFQDNIRSLNNEKEVFDISDQQNGSVLARVVTNKENTNTYTVYIQGEGGVIANENSANLFDSFSKLEAIEGLEHFDTSNAKNMDGMFAKCTALKSLDLSNFDTREVTNMKQMFQECSALENLEIGHFVTDQVTDMQYMFNRCSRLTNLDLSNFDTSQVTDMKYMFS